MSSVSATGIVAFGHAGYKIEPNADALTTTIDAANVPSLSKANLAMEEHINHFGFRESATFFWNRREAGSE